MVVTSWLIVLLGDALPIRSLRVVRVLRPLRSVKRIKGLRVVVEAIMSSLPAISSVCVVGLAIAHDVVSAGHGVVSGQDASLHAHRGGRCE